MVIYTTTKTKGIVGSKMIVINLVENGNHKYQKLFHKYEHEENIINVPGITFGDDNDNDISIKGKSIFGVTEALKILKSNRDQKERILNNDDFFSYIFGKNKNYRSSVGSSIGFYLDNQIIYDSKTIEENIYKEITKNYFEEFLQNEIDDLSKIMEENPTKDVVFLLAESHESTYYKWYYTLLEDYISKKTNSSFGKIKASGNVKTKKLPIASVMKEYLKDEKISQNNEIISMTLKFIRDFGNMKKDEKLVIVEFINE